MKTCFFFGHIFTVHLDYIYGSLPREHIQCSRCRKTIFFKKPTPEREDELAKMGDIRDGATRGCTPL